MHLWCHYYFARTIHSPHQQNVNPPPTRKISPGRAETKWGHINHPSPRQATKTKWKRRQEEASPREAWPTYLSKLQNVFVKASQEEGSPQGGVTHGAAIWPLLLIWWPPKISAPAGWKILLASPPVQCTAALMGSSGLWLPFYGNLLTLTAELMEPHLHLLNRFLLLAANFSKQTNHHLLIIHFLCQSVCWSKHFFAPIPDQFGRKGVKKRNHGKWADAVDGSAHFTIGKKVEIRGGVVRVYTGGDSVVHIVNYWLQRKQPLTRWK